MTSFGPDKTVKERLHLTLTYSNSRLLMMDNGILRFLNELFFHVFFRKKINAKND